MSSTFVTTGALTALAGGASGPDRTDMTIVAPSCNVNDILIAVILGKNNSVITPPDGTWTKFVEGNNTTSQRVTIAWKRAVTGDSGASFLFTRPAGSTSWYGVISAWRGCKTGTTPIDASTPTVSNNASSDTVTYASFDPTETNGHIVAIGVYNNDLTTAGLISGTNPTLTNRWDLESSVGTDGSIFGYSGDSLGGAATGARSHSTTSTADDISIGVLFGLVPEPMLQTVTGSLASVGTMAKTTAHGEAGGLASSGVTVRVASKVLIGATLLLSAVFSAGRVIPQALTAILAMVMSFSKQASTARSGLLTSTGSLGKQTTSGLSVAVLSSTGSSLRAIIHMMSSGLTSLGVIERLIAAQSMTGSLALVASMARQSGRVLSATLVAGGGTLANQTQSVLSGAMSASGTVIRMIVKVIAPAELELSATIEIVNIIQFSFEAVCVMASDLATQSMRFLEGVLTGVGSQTRMVGLVRLAVLTSVGTVARECRRVLSAVVTTAGAVVKGISHTLASGQLSVVGSVTRISQVVRLAVLTTVGSLAGLFILGGGRHFFEVFTATVLLSGTMTKRVGKAVSALIHTVGAFVSLFIPRKRAHVAISHRQVMLVPVVHGHLSAIVAVASQKRVTVSIFSASMTVVAVSDQGG